MFRHGGLVWCTLHYTYTHGHTCKHTHTHMSHTYKDERTYIRGRRHTQNGLIIMLTNLAKTTNNNMADTTKNENVYGAGEGYPSTGGDTSGKAGSTPSSTDDRGQLSVGDQAQAGAKASGRRVEVREEEEGELEVMFVETEEEMEERIREDKERKTNRDRGGVKRKAAGVSKEIKKEMIEEVEEEVVEDKKTVKGKKKKEETHKSSGSENEARRPKIKKTDSGKERGKGKGKEEKGELDKLLEGRSIIYDDTVQKQYWEIEECGREVVSCVNTLDEVMEELDDERAGRKLDKIMDKMGYMIQVVKAACSEAGRLRTQIAVKEIDDRRKEKKKEKEKEESKEGVELAKLRKRIEELEKEKKEMERKMLEERNDFTRIAEKYRKEKEGMDEMLAEVEKKVDKIKKECEKKEKEAQIKVEETKRKEEELKKETDQNNIRKNKLIMYNKEREKELERIGKERKDWDIEAERLGCKLVEKEVQTETVEVTYKDALEMAKKGGRDEKKKMEKEKERNQEWSKVVRRGNTRSGDRGREEEEERKKRREDRGKTNRTRMRREAVIIRTETEKEGDEIMREFREAQGEECTEDIKVVRRTRNGNLVVELEKRGETGRMKEKIEEVAGGRANVIEKIPSIDIEIDDIEPYIGKEEVMDRVMEEYGEGNEKEVKLKVLKRMGRGTNRAVVEVPMTWRRKVSEKGKIRIGNVNCRVNEGVRVLRCFRCHDVGHLSYFCKKEEDRIGNCRRCGGKGHKMEECKGQPRCHICIGRGVPENRTRHNAGTYRCRMEKEMKENKKKGER